jgi:hypothetical protein
VRDDINVLVVYGEVSVLKKSVSQEDLENSDGVYMLKGRTLLKRRLDGGWRVVEGDHPELYEPLALASMQIEETRLIAEGRRPR